MCQEIVTSFLSRKPSDLYRVIFPRLYVPAKVQFSARKLYRHTGNIPESVNFMIKDWVNFLPSEIDRFIISPQDLVQSFQTEEELTWFGLSDKWAVKEEFKDRFPPKSHLQMTPDERKVAL